MRRLYLLLVAFLFCYIDMLCQYNNIFIIDCSRSMICPNAERTNDWKKEEPNLRWEPAKKSLREWIESYEDNDLITLLLFNDNVVSTISEKKKDIEWNKVSTSLDNAVNAHYGKTSICNAWREAEHYFDPSKYNFFYIITDGVDDHNGPCHLVEQINTFCSKIPEGSHGYVLKLDQATFPKEIKDALDNSPCLTPLPIGSIPKFGGFTEDEVSVVTSNMKKGGIDQTSPLYFDRKSKYRINVTSHDPYFDVTVNNGCVYNGALTFNVKLKDDIDLNDLKQNLGVESYEIDVTLDSEDIKIVRNNTITIEVILKPTSELQLFSNISQIELGHSTWYKEFIIPQGNPDTLSFVIKPKFNQEALASRASVSLTISNLPTALKTYVNGISNSGIIKIESNDSILVQFVPEVPCEDFDIEAALSIVASENLDRVSGKDKVVGYSIGIVGDVKEKYNSVKVGVVSIFVICTFLLILWIFYVLIRPTMRGKLVLINANGLIESNLGDITGYHKVYLTNGANKDKRDILDAILLTKRKYIHIDNLPDNIKITGNSKKIIYIHPSKKVKINGVFLITKKKLLGKQAPVFSLNWGNSFDNKINIKYF